jgi:transposase
MWCVPTLDAEYIACIEDVLNVLARPYARREPVVTIDERPVVLRGASRPGRVMAPGQIAREDYEYVRKGTANVYCIVEPKAGRHLTHATRDRKGPRFVDALQRIARRYRNAKTIHLIMDNLNLHGPSPLMATLGAAQGAALWARFTPHYTPKHGSWLNPAEIEASLWSRECHGRDRVDTFEALRDRTRAWTARADRCRRTTSGDLLPPRHGESSATNGEALCRGRGTSGGVG